MRANDTITLRDCTRFRETIEAQPPAVAHLGVMLCVVTLAAALAWAALTPVDLVVRGTGRVRPLEVPTQVYSAVSQHVEGRVVEVRVEEGNIVHKGDILLRLDTQRLDHEIGKTRRALEAARAELEKLGQLTDLQGRHFKVAKSKAIAELDRATAELARVREARESDIRGALIKLETARDQHARAEKLVANHTISQQQMVETKADLRTADENLRRVRVPLEDGHLKVLRQAVVLIDRDYAVRTAELETRMITKQQEVDTAIKELADLERQSAQAILRSPVDGVVTKGQFHIGDVLPPGNAVFEIAPQGGYCFESTIASQDMGLVHDRMSARVKLDAYDYQLYGSLSGPVCFISPDTSNQNSKGATTHEMTYRVRVSLTGDRIGQGEFKGVVKLGMAGQVEIITDRHTVLSILIKRIRSSISLG